MSLVAVILCVVLGMFCFTRVHAFRAESEIAMRQMLDSPRSKEPPENDTKPHSPSLDFGPGGRNPAFNSTPVFLVTLDENNEITDTNSSGSYTVTDTLSEAAVSAAFAVSEDQGYLSNLKLRFIKQNTPEGTKICLCRYGPGNTCSWRACHSVRHDASAFSALFSSGQHFSGTLGIKTGRKGLGTAEQFIADASHELKTPLTVILANLRILLSHKDATIRDELQWVESTQEEAGRMKKLVENLLFLARSDAESTPMLYSTFSFSDLILGCLLTFEPVAFEQGVMIEDEISDDIFISGDAPQIRQLVAILLDNACKYAGIADVLEKSGSSDKKVTVTLTSENEKIKLTVHNTGKAIPEEDLPHLFERFYRTGQIASPHGRRLWTWSCHRSDYSKKPPW